MPGPPALPGELSSVLAALEGVASRPLAEHVEVFDTVHRQLQDALATLDQS